MSHIHGSIQHAVVFGQISKSEYTVNGIVAECEADSPGGIKND